MTIRPVRFCSSDMARDTLPARAKKKKNVQIDGLHIAEITRVRLDALVNEGTMLCRFLITHSSAIAFIEISRPTSLLFHFFIVNFMRYTFNVNDNEKLRINKTNTQNFVAVAKKIQLINRPLTGASILQRS